MTRVDIFEQLFHKPQSRDALAIRSNPILPLSFPVQSSSLVCLMRKAAMGIGANGLAIALLLAASSAQAQTCNEAQYARLRQLQKAYSSTWDAMLNTPGREVLAGQNGVVHSKAYCAATERHIKAGETLVRFIESAGCFQAETGPTWRKRVRETIDEERSGCRMTPKRVYTEQDRRRARKDVNYFQRCAAAKEAQGMSRGAANAVCINETLTRGN